MRPAALAAITNALMALPAHAEAGKIFDFNLTLPIMAGQFLLLMVFLDKFWFGPVGKVLDERDGYIREQLKKFKVRNAHQLLFSVFLFNRFLFVTVHACVNWPGWYLRASFHNATV